MCTACKGRYINITRHRWKQCYYNSRVHKRGIISIKELPLIMFGHVQPPIIKSANIPMCRGAGTVAIFINWGSHPWLDVCLITYFFTFLSLDCQTVFLPQQSHQELALSTSGVGGENLADTLFFLSVGFGLNKTVSLLKGNKGQNQYLTCVFIGKI